MRYLWVLIGIFFNINALRDPFSLPTIPVAPSKSFFLKGILMSDQPIASIEYEGIVYLVGVNERIRDVQVLAITESGVTLRLKNGDTMNISLN